MMPQQWKDLQQALEKERACSLKLQTDLNRMKTELQSAKMEGENPFLFLIKVPVYVLGPMIIRVNLHSVLRLFQVYLQLRGNHKCLRRHFFNQSLF